MSIPIFVFNSILLGTGLAMDAFSVCLANALAEPDMTGRRRADIAAVYGIFQAVMPMAGWILVRTLVQAFDIVEAIIPWAALILLLLIGGKMLLEGLKGAGERHVSRLTRPVLLLQGIATSIDAVSVGLTMASRDLVMALSASLIIGSVTFGICMAGLRIGCAVGTRISGRALILGGLILIGIGIEIFVTGLFF